MKLNFKLAALDEAEAEVKCFIYSISCMKGNVSQGQISDSIKRILFKVET